MSNTQQELYNDVELRVIVLPLAIALVNTEVQRTLNRCNTSAVAEIVKELVDILRYGKVQEVVKATSPEPTVDTKVNDTGLKYA